MRSAKEIIAHLCALQNEAQRQVLVRFFKTAPGQYGHGDQFLGIKVGQTRAVAKQAKGTPLDEIVTLLHSPWHEVRLCGLLLLVAQFEQQSRPRCVQEDAAIARRDEILTLYLRHAERANNWDLVDVSAPKIVGHWLLLPTRLGDKRHILDAQASSDNLWRQRISMVCTWKPLQQGEAAWCLRYAEMHLHHPHDLMHKAVGWMLREMGKRVSMELLRDFLRQHAHEMPRTALRYAIEKMPPEERQQWLRAGRV